MNRRDVDLGSLIRECEQRGLDDRLTLRPRESAQLRNLHAATVPVPGRAGWRVDREGREWFSSAWLDERP